MWFGDATAIFKYSRNAYDSPAYSIVYRSFRGPLAQMGLPSSTTADAPERQLVASANRGNAGSLSMGHGEVFVGPQGNYYLVYHVKQRDVITENPLGFCGGQRALPNRCNPNPTPAERCRLVDRFVAIKELRFIDPPGALSTGQTTPELDPEILPFTDDGSGGPTDAGVFLVPYVCPADFNQDGEASVQDIFDFLAAWNELDVTADVNATGDVTTQDIFDFLNSYFTGCEPAAEE